MTHQPSAAHEAMAAELDASGNYRVLRRFQPLQHYGAPDSGAISRGVLIDVETTPAPRSTTEVLNLKPHKVGKFQGGLDKTDKTKA